MNIHPVRCGVIEQVADGDQPVCTNSDMRVGRVYAYSYICMNCNMGMYVREYMHDDMRRHFHVQNTS